MTLVHDAASAAMGSVLHSALQRQTRISASLNVCSDRCSILGSHPQRKSGFRPLWQNETIKLEVFGSFRGSFHTGEMRTPLDSKQVLLFDLEIWFLLLLLVK
jgi:predicted nucleic acid-binding Zn ribbon protein